MREQEGPAVVASRRHGIITLAELLACGVDKSAITRRIKAGTLWRLHPGVYSVVPPELLTMAGRFSAAVLACREGAALSHISAAAWWGFLADPGGDPHVTVPRSGAKSVAGVRLHRSRSFPSVIHQGLRVTSVERVLIDLADTYSFPFLRCAARAAGVAQLPLGSPREKVNGRRGAPLVKLLELSVADYERMRSELEVRFKRLCRKHGIPRPEWNEEVIEGVECDFVWRDVRLVVEVDGWRFHGDRVSFEDDRAKDVMLELAGWRVARFTYLMVWNQPGVVARKVLALRGLGPPALA